MKSLRQFINLACALLVALPLFSSEPVPDKIVVLTFDDSVKSHYTVALPLLVKYGFGASFFITEGFHFKTDKKNYMTWSEISELHKAGFEIGNHTRDHLGITDATYEKLPEQLESIARSCEAHGIPHPVSFAWPGNAFTEKALAILKQNGIRFARRGAAPELPYEGGRGIAYDPQLDHPLLIPTAADARPAWTLDDFITGVKKARNGNIAVIQFHGVPEGEHPWVHTPKKRFEEYMKYLHDKHYRVLALRDIAKYFDSKDTPKDAMAPIERRQEAIRRGKFKGGVRLSYQLDLSRHPDLARRTSKIVQRALFRRLSLAGIEQFRVELAGFSRIHIDVSPSNAGAVPEIKSLAESGARLRFALARPAKDAEIKSLKSKEARFVKSIGAWVQKMRAWGRRRSEDPEFRDSAPEQPRGPQQVLRFGAEENSRAFVIDQRAQSGIDGASIRDAHSTLSENGDPSLTIEFAETTAAAMRKLTSTSIGRQMAILLDENVLSTPTIRATFGARAQITGNFTHEDIEDFARSLRGGALPVRLELQGESKIP